MCKLCDRPHPTQAECFKLFYMHDGELYRQALPRSEFGTQSSYTLYNKGANKPYRNYTTVHVLGYGRMPIGAILTIMDEKTVSSWYHRERERRNQYGIFVTRGYPRARADIIEDDEDDEDDEGDFKQYPRIPPNHRFKKVFSEFMRG